MKMNAERQKREDILRRPERDQIVDPKRVLVVVDKRKFRVLEFLCSLQLLHALLDSLRSGFFRVSCAMTLQLFFRRFSNV